MGLLIKHKKQYLTRIPLGLLLISLFAFAPIIIGMLGSWITKLVTGGSCGTNNCIWAVVPYLMIASFPLSLMALALFLLLITIDSVGFLRKKKTH
ncbi:MAG: hypothetical protein ACPHXR_04965 [Flavicella sp.]